jgi:hypothetical protein
MLTFTASYLKGISPNHTKMIDLIQCTCRKEMLLGSTS